MTKCFSQEVTPDVTYCVYKKLCLFCIVLSGSGRPEKEDSSSSTHPREEREFRAEFEVEVGNRST